MINFRNILYAFVGALILSAVFIGLRVTALRSAYDASTAFSLNDSAGVSHSVAASPISGDTTALIYTVATGFIWLAFAIYAVFQVVTGLKSGAK